MLLLIKCKRLDKGLLMSRKYQIIVFEGPDKSGKSTLVREFNKATNFAYLVLDRGTVSSKVYSELFGRGDYDFYDKLEKELIGAVKVLYVCCFCDVGTIKLRLKEHKEILPPQLSNIENVTKAFLEEVKTNNKDYLLLNTKSSLRANLKTLMEFLGETNGSKSSVRHR